jgi:tRNA A-37 threonylcarbamoyl transferase component Bud32
MQPRLDDSPHLTADEIHALLKADPDAPGRLRAVKHSESCEGCQKLVGEALRAFGSYGSTEVGPNPPRAALANGAQLGRYTVVSPLGEGAVGQVYAALQPELDRLVALKVIRLPPPGVAREHVSARVQREGRALARLNHPNVITVHEIGEADGCAFVAMELVRGGTLRTWSVGRPWQQVLRALVQAGRGLAAAHRVGLVHRDFKPQNVLVGDDGSVRVTDFGLARSGDLPPDSSGGEVPVLSTAATLTHTGAAVGTPAYMAPEQLGGALADARSDQFSFCVTALECLCDGVRPFQGSSASELRRNIEAGAFTAVPAQVRVPKRVLRLLQRGLSASPAARFATLDRLLDLLEPPSRHWPFWAIAAAALVVALGLVLLPGRRALALCEQSTRWDGVWDDAERAAVQTAFSATTLPYQAQAFSQVRGALDDYTARWSDAQRQRCLAASGEGPYGLSCLRQRREDVRQLVAALVRADRQLVDRAADLSISLPVLSRCELTADAVPRGSPPSAEEEGTLQGTLASARAAFLRGGLVDAQRLAEQAAAGAEAARLPLLQAEAQLLRAQILHELRQPTDAKSAFAAATIAERAGLHALAAEAWLNLAAMVAGQSGAAPEQWVQLAEIAVQRAGAPIELQAQLMSVRGFTLVFAGEFTGAVELQREAAALLTAKYGAADARVVSSNYPGGESRHDRARRRIRADHPRGRRATEGCARRRSPQLRRGARRARRVPLPQRAGGGRRADSRDGHRGVPGPTRARFASSHGADEQPRRRPGDARPRGGVAGAVPQAGDTARSAPWLAGRAVWLGAAQPWQRVERLRPSRRRHRPAAPCSEHLRRGGRLEPAKRRPHPGRSGRGADRAGQARRRAPRAGADL